MTDCGKHLGPDRLIIRGLELQCVVGVHDWERLMPQRIVVDITLRGDFTAAAESDDLGMRRITAPHASRAAEVAASGEYRLVETLADRIASATLETHLSITSDRRHS